MYKLAYIIPTKDSAKYLDACLEAFRSSFLKFGAAVYILDASEDDSSMRVYEKHKTDGIIYEHMPRTSIQYRFFHALNNINAEYICLGKDNQFPTYEGAAKIMELIGRGYDMFQTSAFDPKHLGVKEYHNIAWICKDCAFHATLFGIVYLRKSAYKPVTYEQFHNECGNNEFFHLVYYYNYPIDAESFRGFHCSSYPYPYDLPRELHKDRKRRGSYWATKEQFFEVACREFLCAVNKFTCITPDDKKQVIRDYSVYCLQFDRYRSWVSRRADGRIDCQHLREYKDDIMRMTSLNYRIIYAIAAMPVPVLKCIKTAVQCIKKFLGLAK